MIQTAIITAPRPDDRNYISNSLDSYFREWDIKPWVFEEPGMPDYRFGSWCQRNKNFERLGIVRNWIWAARTLVNDSDEPWLMICEDDIEWRMGSSHFLRSFIMSKPKNMGFVSAYTSVENAMRDLRSGEWHFPYFTNNNPQHWCGACALAFPREALRRLVFDLEEELIENCKGASDTPIHLDCGISDTLVKHHYDLRCHSPSLVDHRGEVSTNEVNNTKGKTLARTPAI